MSYQIVEQSLADGQPVELYEFKQHINYWFYTSGVDAVEWNARSFVPAAITRSAVTQSNEMSGAKLTLVFPRDHPFVAQFVGMSPDFPTTLTIFRGHATDTAKEWAAYWKGRVVRASATRSEVTLECESLFSSMQRTGCRARFQLTCRHALYSAACGVSSALHRTTALVQSSTSSSLICTGVSSFPNGWFTGGIVQFPSGTLRFISEHKSDLITCTRPFTENVNGQTVSVFPGCDHAKQTCINKFDNLLNFGGFPYIPVVNPFGGGSLA